MSNPVRPVAIASGASAGIGLHLARIATERDYDLIVAADRPLDQAVLDMESLGATVEQLQVDLAKRGGIDALLALPTRNSLRAPTCWSPSWEATLTR